MIDHRPTRTRQAPGAHDPRRQTLHLAISIALGASLAAPSTGGAQNTTYQKPLPPPRPATVNTQAQARTAPSNNGFPGMFAQNNANNAAAQQRNTPVNNVLQPAQRNAAAGPQAANVAQRGTPVAPQGTAAAQQAASAAQRNAATPVANAFQRLFGARTTAANSPATAGVSAAAAGGGGMAASRSLTQNTTAQKFNSGTPVTSRYFPGHPAPPGSTERQASNGSIVRTAADGSVLDVHNPRTGVSIHHAPDGSRRITVDRPDHSKIYIPARGVQYVEHPYMFKGHPMVNRTLVVQGRTVHQIYRPYTYGNTTLDVYATSRYFAPNMYQWASSRLKAPERFAWTYTSEATPWYGHYRGYFTPDTSYVTPLAWLTDYMVAASLFSSYSTRNEAADPPPANAAPVTPEIKQKLATEVGRQVQSEAAEAEQSSRNVDPPAAAGSIVQTLADRQPHVFLVSSDIDLMDSSGRRCSVSEGDVVQVTSSAKGDSSTVDGTILSSKGGAECGRAVQVQIALEDVQEMQNHMRETIDQGLATTKLAKETQSKTPEFAAAAPPPDANAASEIKQQQDIAAAAEG